MRVRVDLNISLDGYASTIGTPENPMGDDWMKLVEAYVATRTFRERVFGDTSGAGTTGVDDHYAAAYFEGIGAEVMGAGMFGLHMHPNDPEWQGWWGDDPPFHYPVFVLTHESRPSLVLEGDNTFHFIATSPEEALALAVAESGGKDIRIGGGPTVVREFMQAGLVDDLHVAIVPVLLGQGIRLWDDLREFEVGRTVTTEVAESGVVHMTFKR